MTVDVYWMKAKKCTITPDNDEMVKKSYMNVHMRAGSLNDSTCTFDCVTDGHLFTMTLKELVEQSNILQNAIWHALAEERERIKKFGLIVDKSDGEGGPAYLPPVS